MADEIHAAGEPASEPGEPIHMPVSSYIPVVVAAATTIAIVGVVLSWFLVALGLIVNIVAIGLWIRDTRRDIADLPLEH